MFWEVYRWSLFFFHHAQDIAPHLHGVFDHHLVLHAKERGLESELDRKMMSDHEFSMVLHTFQDASWWRSNGNPPINAGEERVEYHIDLE